MYSMAGRWAPVIVKTAHRVRFTMLCKTFTSKLPCKIVMLFVRAVYNTSEEADDDMGSSSKPFDMSLWNTLF